MNIVSLLLVVALGCVMVQTTSGLLHIVGGITGWTEPPTKNFYCDWASRRTFRVGDKLVFPYSPAAHTLTQVGKRDFDTCGSSNVIFRWMMGPTTVSLTAPGDFYFFCGVGKHCEMGQKLHIKVGTRPGSNRRH